MTISGLDSTSTGLVFLSVYILRPETSHRTIRARAWVGSSPGLDNPSSMQGARTQALAAALLERLGRAAQHSSHSFAKKAQQQLFGARRIQQD